MAAKDEPDNDIEATDARHEHPYLSPNEARKRLATLMPFDDWCKAMKPTEAAKEMYRYVLECLQRRAGCEKAVAEDEEQSALPPVQKETTKSRGRKAVPRAATPSRRRGTRSHEK